MQRGNNHFFFFLNTLTRFRIYYHVIWLTACDLVQSICDSDTTSVMSLETRGTGFQKCMNCTLKNALIPLFFPLAIWYWYESTEYCIIPNAAKLCETSGAWRWHALEEAVSCIHFQILCHASQHHTHSLQSLSLNGKYIKSSPIINPVFQDNYCQYWNLVSVWCIKYIKWNNSSMNRVSFFFLVFVLFHSM